MRKLKKIYIEITNRCNLACSFCHKSGRPPGSMTLADFAAILEKVRGHTEHLSLHVLGEPLLHPDLGGMLALCHAQGFKVNLTTNGSLLARNVPLLLASPALRQLNISLHSVSEAPLPTQEGYLKEILEVVRLVRDLTNIYISLRLWNFTEAGANGGTRRNESVLAQLERSFALSEPLADALAGNRGLTLAPRIFLSQGRRFTWPHGPGPDLGVGGFCHGLRTHVAILVDGTVVPCCLDAEADIPLGNIFRQQLGEILDSPRARNMRDGFGRHLVVEPLCRRCSFRLPFGGRRMAGGVQIKAA